MDFLPNTHTHHRVPRSKSLRVDTIYSFVLRAYELCRSPQSAIRISNGDDDNDDDVVGKGQSQNDYVGNLFGLQYALCV